MDYVSNRSSWVNGQGANWDPTTQDHPSRTFSKLQITDLNTLKDKDVQVFEPGILVKGCSHQIVAPYESGKTFLSWICARELLKSGLRVCYLDYENRESSTQERLDAIGINYSDWNNPLYLNNPILDLSKDSKGQWGDFLDFYRPNLVIFDSLNGFLSNAGKEENSSTGFQEWANTYLKIPRRMEITTLVIDHTGWDGTHSRGTSRKPDEFDVVWSVKVKKKFSRSKTGEIQLDLIKDRDSLVPNDKLNFVLGGTPFEFEEKESSSTKDNLSDDQVKIHNLIIENTKDGNGTPRKSINELFNGSKSRADKTIKFLLKEDLIYQDEESKLYWALDSSMDSSFAESPETPGTDLDSLANEVKGKGSRGPGPKGPDPRTLSPTNSENLEDYNIDTILEDIDTLDFNERGIEVLKAVTSVCLEHPLLTYKALSKDNIAPTSSYLEKIISMVGAKGVTIKKRDLGKAIEVLDENFAFLKVVVKEAKKVVDSGGTYDPKHRNDW